MSVLNSPALKKMSIKLYEEKISELDAKITKQLKECTFLNDVDQKLIDDFNYYRDLVEKLKEELNERERQAKNQERD